jgi:hypothetical protein
MTINSPEAVRVTALGLGPLTLIAGMLLPRMQGAMELSPTRFKGQIGSIPTALLLSRRAAENVIPEGEPDRDRRAQKAAEQAVATLLILDGFDEWRWTSRPPDEPPLDKST